MDFWFSSTEQPYVSLHEYQVVSNHTSTLQVFLHKTVPNTGTYYQTAVLHSMINFLNILHIPMNNLLGNYPVTLRWITTCDRNFTEIEYTIHKLFRLDRNYGCYR